MNAVIVRSSFFLFLVQAANMILPLLTLPYLLRVLGSYEFGILVFSQALVAYFVLLTDYGFNLTGTRRIAETGDDFEKRSVIFSEIIVAKAALAIVSAGIIAGIVHFIPTVSGRENVVAAAAVILIGSVMFPQWLFQGMERLGFVSMSVITSRVIILGLTFVFVKTQEDAWIAALTNAVGTVVAGVIAIVLIRRHRLVEFRRPSMAGIRACLHDGWHVFISTAAISLYTTTNSIALGLIGGPVAVGHFAAADKIRAGAQAGVTPISNAFYPRINALMSQNKDAAFRLIRKLLVIQSGITACIAAGLVIFAPQIVRIVMGPGYEESITVLRIIGFLPLAIGLSNVFGIQTMLTLGMKREFSRIVLFSGLLNIILLVPLAWAYGATGAAVAVLITEITVTCTMGLVLLKRKVPVFTFRS